MKFTIGEIIPYDNALKTSYVLHIISSHGDADEDTFRTRTFNENDDSAISALEKVIQFCDIFKNIDNLDAKQLTKLANSTATDLGIACSGNDMLLELIPYDKIYIGRLAILTDFFVTYFDEFGIEHKVSIG